MPLRLSEHPERDRPRERLWSVCPAALTGQELLAILLGTGCSGRDALAVAAEVLARVDGSLRRLAGRRHEPSTRASTSAATASASRPLQPVPNRMARSSCPVRAAGQTLHK